MVDKVTAEKVNEKKTEKVASVFEKMAEEQLSRMETFHTEMAKAQEKGFQQAQQAIDETARLFKESLAYQMKLSGEFQKMALAQTRQAAQLFQNPFLG